MSAVFALVDCNNFYTSCEKIFYPALQEKPVVVLSNNDGCIIARSEEAKSVGIKLRKDEFAKGNQHINGIESFWSYAKRHLVQFNGIPRHTFYLHLKEIEFRFNHRNDNLYLATLKLLRENPLSSS